LLTFIILFNRNYSHTKVFAHTLFCAVTEILHDVYDEWWHTYHKASTPMQVRLFILIFP